MVGKLHELNRYLKITLQTNGAGAGIERVTCQLKLEPTVTLQLTEPSIYILHHINIQVQQKKL